jgi:hypothetical protein
MEFLRIVCSSKAPLALRGRNAMRSFLDGVTGALQRELRVNSHVPWGTKSAFQDIRTGFRSPQASGPIRIPRAGRRARQRRGLVFRRWRRLAQCPRIAKFHNAIRLRTRKTARRNIPDAPPHSFIVYMRDLRGACFGAPDVTVVHFVEFIGKVVEKTLRSDCTRAWLLPS